jgi:hypothetical protein
MTPNSQAVQNELKRRHRAASLVVAGFLALDIVLLAIAFFASAFIFRPGDPGLVMGLWIAILVFGLGAFVVRRTKFAAMRLKDVGAVKGVSGLLKTLQDTTIQIADPGNEVGFVRERPPLWIPHLHTFIRSISISSDRGNGCALQRHTKE